MGSAPWTFTFRDELYRAPTTAEACSKEDFHLWNLPHSIRMVVNVMSLEDHPDGRAGAESNCSHISPPEAVGGIGGAVPLSALGDEAYSKLSCEVHTFRAAVALAAEKGRKGTRIKLPPGTIKLMAAVELNTPVWIEGCSALAPDPTFKSGEVHGHARKLSSVLQASGQHRLLQIGREVSVHLSALRLERGRALALSKGVYLGGAVFNEGYLSMVNCAFAFNHAVYGGAVYSENGVLQSCRLTFFNNQAACCGGAAFTASTHASAVHPFPIYRNSFRDTLGVCAPEHYHPDHAMLLGNAPMDVGRGREDSRHTINILGHAGYRPRMPFDDAGWTNVAVPAQFGSLDHLKEEIARMHANQGRQGMLDPVGELGARLWTPVTAAAGQIWENLVG